MVMPEVISLLNKVGRMWPARLMQGIQKACYPSGSQSFTRALLVSKAILFDGI